MPIYSQTDFEGAVNLFSHSYPLIGFHYRILSQLLVPGGGVGKEPWPESAVASESALDRSVLHTNL